MAEYEVDTLAIKVDDQSEGAGEGVEQLSNALSQLKNNVQGSGKGLTNLSKKLEELKTATEGLASSSKKLGNMATVLRNMQNLQNVNIPKTLPDRLLDIGAAMELITPDAIANLKEMTSSLQKLSGVDLKGLPSALRSLQSSAVSGASEVIDPSVTAEIQSVSDSVEQLDESLNQVKVDKIQPSDVISAETSSEVKATSDKVKGLKTELKSVKSIKVKPKVDTSEIESATKKTNALVTLLKSVGRIAWYRAIRSMLSSLVEGFQEAAQQNESVNSTLSEIVSSVHYLRDAVVAALLPAIQAITPILTTILDALADVFNFVAKIIGMLTGQSSVVQATKQQINYAESLEDTASAAKEALKYLLPIDELNIMDGTSSGGGTSTNGVHFVDTDTDLSSTLGDLAGSVIASPEWSVDPVPAPAFETVVVPDEVGETLESPSWSPDPVLAPVFEAITLPDWVGEILASPVWSTNPILAPIFAELTFPAWMLTPLPVPEWAENPIEAPEIELSPLTAGITAIEDALGELETDWGAKFESLQQVTAERSEEIRSELQETEDAIGSLATTWGEKFESLQKATAERNEAIQTEFQQTEDALGQLETAWKTHYEGIQQTNAEINEEIRSELQETADFIESAFNNPTEDMESTFSDGLKSVLEDSKNWSIKEGNLFAKISSYIAATTANGLNSANGSFVDWMNQNDDDTTAYSNGLLDKTNETSNSVYDTITSGLKQAWVAYQNLKNAINGDKSTFSIAKYFRIGNSSISSSTKRSTSTLIPSFTFGSLPFVLPAFASGGVLTEPTAILAGEYAGAKSNPEIVTPQNILRETFRDEQNTEEIISAIYAMGEQMTVKIVEAINNGSNIYFDGTKVASTTTNIQNRQNRMYGKTLQNA